MRESEEMPDFLREAFAKAIELADAAAANANYPIGAVVCGPDGILSAVSSNLVESYDPSAHPELCAIRQACETKRTRYLRGTFLVSTLEPCPMCTSAAIWARMDGIAFSSTQADAKEMGRRLQSTKFTFRQIGIRCAEVARVGDPRLTVFEGYAREDVLKIYDRFAVSVCR